MIKRRLLLLLIPIAIVVLISSVKPVENTSISSVAQSIELGKKPQPVYGTEVDSKVLRCVPNEGAKYELLGEVRDRNTSYSLLSIYEYADADPKEQWDVLIQHEEVGCLLLHHLGSGLEPLSAYIPIDSARQLELQRYEKWIKKLGSKEKLQKHLASRLSDRAVPHYFSQEQIWALQQLSIQIPKTYKILRSNQ
ncbi:MAG: hypothetical protein MUC48_20825 [Leptolyngbya sp. Prado105]|jgi:hypothetical protein|nr:hypothetical protein [Leptolyngbya sp. Prado105]